MNPLFYFRDMLVWLSDFTYRHYRFTSSLAFLFLIVLFPFAKPLHVFVTVDELINRNDETSKDYFKLKNEFKLHTNAFLIFEKPGTLPFNEKELCDIKKWVMIQRLELPHIRESFSPLFIRELYKDTSSNGLSRLAFPTIVKLECDGGRRKDPLAAIDATPWKGLMAREDHQDFTHDFQISHLDEHNFVTEKLVPFLENLHERARDLPKGIKVHWLGDAHYQFEMARGLVFNNSLNLFIVIFILLIFRLLFGTWRSGFLFLLTLIYSCSVIVLLMSIFNVPIDILNNSLFLLLAVSSLGDFIFLSQHEVDHEHAERPWAMTFKELILPCFFTSFTTFIGFISLCTSEVEIVSRLGLWAGLSGLVEWITTLLVMPALLRFFFKNKTWVNPRKVWKLLPMRKIHRYSLPRWICRLLLLAFFFAPFTFQRMNISDIPNDLFKKDNPFYRSVEYLFETRGFKGEASLVFEDKDQELFNQKVLEDLKKHPNVARIENPYEMLSYFTKGLTPEEERVMKSGLKETPQFQRFFSDSRIRAVIYLKEGELRDVVELRRLVKSKYCSKGECSLSGVLVAYAEFSQSVSKTLLSSFLLSFVLVFITILLLCYYTANMKYAFPLLASSLWGVAVTLILLYMFQVKINFVTSVVVAMMVGMNGDNTIQFILGGMEKGIYQGVRERAQGSIVTAFILIISSVTFLFYYFEPPAVFGRLLMAGFLASLVGDLWILKGLLPKEVGSEDPTLKN
jgi:predicted RND superfamily exporter protein